MFFLRFMHGIFSRVHIVFFPLPNNIIIPENIIWGFSGSVPCMTRRIAPQITSEPLPSDFRFTVLPYCPAVQGPEGNAGLARLPSQPAGGRQKEAGSLTGWVPLCGTRPFTHPHASSWVLPF